jgi:hypothetical protein
VAGAEARNNVSGFGTSDSASETLSLPNADQATIANSIENGNRTH